MSIHTCSYYCDRSECVLAQRDELRQKLEQAEKQEPFAVAWVLDGELFWPSEYEVISQAGDKAIPLYTAPVHAIDISQERVDEMARDQHEFECPRCGHCCQQKEWVGLTDGEMVDLLKDYEGRLWTDIFPAIEAKLKEKNCFATNIS